VAWQRSVDLVERIYRITGGWPKAEIYGLTNQIRRAAVSVPANIAEGQGRSSRKEFAHHVAIAYGSLCEVETHLIIANRLEYVDTATFDDLIIRTTEVARPLHGLMQSLQEPTSIYQRPKIGPLDTPACSPLPSGATTEYCLIRRVEGDGPVKPGSLQRSSL